MKAGNNNNYNNKIVDGKKIKEQYHNNYFCFIDEMV